MDIEYDEFNVYTVSVGDAVGGGGSVGGGAKDLGGVAGVASASHVAASVSAGGADAPSDAAPAVA